MTAQTFMMPIPSALQKPSHPVAIRLTGRLTTQNHPHDFPKSQTSKRIIAISAAVRHGTALCPAGLVRSLHTNHALVEPAEGPEVRTTVSGVSKNRIPRSRIPRLPIRCRAACRQCVSENAGLNTKPWPVPFSVAFLPASPRALVRLRTGCLHDMTPLFDLTRDVLSKRGGALLHRLEAELPHPCFNR